MHQLTGTVSQIPRPTRSAVNPPHIKIARAEEVPSSFRVHTGIVAIEYPSPAASDLGSRIESRVCEVGVPLLRNEGGVAGVGGGGGEWEHMNAFNEFRIGAEVGCVVDLVLEKLDSMSMLAPKAKEHAEGTYDARCLIGNEIGRLVGIIRPHEEVTIDRPGQDSEHEITSRFEALVASYISPHLQGVCEMSVLGATLFIFTVGGLE